MSELSNYIKTSEKLFSIIFALFIGVIFDKIILGKPFGISYIILIALSITFFLWSMRRTIKLKANFGWLLLIPINMLAFNFAFYTNPVLHTLNILMITILMVTSSILISNCNVKWDKLEFIREILYKIIITPFKNIESPFKILVDASNIKNNKGISSTQKQVMLGILISLPLLLLIISLLVSADMVFSYYMVNITNIFANLNANQMIFETIIIVVVALYLFCYVWDFRKSEKEEIRQAAIIKWEPITIITILLMLNVLYTLFTIIQFSYLYKWVGGSLPAGFTFAEYARRGFFELVAVTIVNFIILISCFSFMKKENRKLSVIANSMLTLLILFTINMLWSAHSRLYLYEITYGLTYLRVFVHLFMLLLFVLCLIALVSIWYNKLPFIKTVIVVSIISYTLVNYINIDGFIAKNNMKNEKLDIEYLITLSDEVIPYLIEIENNAELNQKDKDLVKDNLQQRDERLNSHNNWYEFNFSSNNGRKLLKSSRNVVK